MFRYVKVKDNVITGLAKLEDEALPMEEGETQYICPPYESKNEPQVGWQWNDANPAPAPAAA